MFKKSTRAQRGPKQHGEKSRGSGRIEVARHGQDWLTLVHGPKARLLLSTSKRYFGRSGLSQLY